MWFTVTEMYECKNLNKERKQLEIQEKVKFSLCCHRIWSCDSNLISTAEIPGGLGKSVSRSGMLHPQPNHKCGFTAKHNISIFSFCVVESIKCRQHQTFTNYGILFLSMKYHNIIFTYLGQQIPGSTWKKHFGKKSFFMQEFLVEIIISAIFSNKLNNC